jgi:hypothetical protein
MTQATVRCSDFNNLMKLRAAPCEVASAKNRAMLRTPVPKSTPQSRIIATQKWQKMRAPFNAVAPFNSRLALSGIRAKDGVAYGPDARRQLLAQRWGTVFVFKPIDERKAKTCTEAHQMPRRTNDISPPTIDDIYIVLRLSRRSAPGPDGIPHAAWPGVGPTGCRTTPPEMVQLLVRRIAPTPQQRE